MHIQHLPYLDQVIEKKQVINVIIKSCLPDWADSFSTKVYCYNGNPRFTLNLPSILMVFFRLSP